MTAQVDITNDVIMANQSKVDTENTTDWLNGGQFTVNYGISRTRTMNKNNLTQVQESTCAGTSTNVNTGNFIYASNSKVGGDFKAFNQKGDATANCSISNSAKFQNYNKLRTGSGVHQSNTGMMVFISMMVMIAAIGIAGFVALTMIFKPHHEKVGPPECGIDAVDCNNCCDTDPCADPCPQCLPDGITKCKPHVSLLEHATGALDDAQKLSGKLSETSTKLLGDFDIDNLDMSSLDMMV